MIQHCSEINHVDCKYRKTKAIYIYFFHRKLDDKSSIAVKYKINPSSEKEFQTDSYKNTYIARL